MGGFQLAALFLLSVVLTSQSVYGQEDIVPLNEDESDIFNAFGKDDDNAFPPEDIVDEIAEDMPDEMPKDMADEISEQKPDEPLDILCPGICECSQDQKADGLKITADCSSKGLDHLPEANEFDSRTNILLLNGNQLEYLDSAISALKELEELNLDDNTIANIATGSISELPKLRRLSLANNKLEAFPEDLKPANSLTTIDLSGNYFSEAVTAGDFSLLGNIKSIVLPNAVPSLIIELCEQHTTLEQVCTESCYTDVNECAKPWTTTSEDLAEVDRTYSEDSTFNDSPPQESLVTDPSKDILEIIDNFSTEETPGREILFSATLPAITTPLDDNLDEKYNPDGESLADLEPRNVQVEETTDVETKNGEDAHVENPAGDTPVTDNSMTELPVESNAFENFAEESEIIEDTSGEHMPVEENTEEKEKDPTVGSVSIGGTTVLPVPPNTELILEKDQNEQSLDTLEEEAKQNLTEEATSVEAELEETSSEKAAVEESPEHELLEKIYISQAIVKDTLVEEAPTENHNVEKPPAEEILVAETALPEISPEKSSFSDVASVEEVPFILTTGNENGIKLQPEVILHSEESNTVTEISVNPEDSSTATTLPDEKAVDKSTIGGFSTEQLTIDDNQATKSSAGEDTTESNKPEFNISDRFIGQPPEPEENGGVVAESKMTKIDGGLQLLQDVNTATTNVNEETETKSIDSNKLSESETTDDQALDKAENVTAHATTPAEIDINVYRGGVDNIIIALVIACMVCVVAGVTIRKNWATIRKKIKPRGRMPNADTTRNGVTPEEVPLQDKSPV